VKSSREEEKEEDKDTEKKREWDEYVESHGNGSGYMGFMEDTVRFTTQHCQSMIFTIIVVPRFPSECNVIG